MKRPEAPDLAIEPATYDDLDPLYTKAVNWLNINGNFTVRSDEAFHGEINGVPVVEWGSSLVSTLGVSAIRHVVPKAADTLGLQGPLKLVYALPHWSYSPSGEDDYIYVDPGVQIVLDKGGVSERLFIDRHETAEEIFFETSRAFGEEGAVAANYTSSIEPSDLDDFEDVLGGMVAEGSFGILDITVDECDALSQIVNHIEEIAACS